MARQAILTPDEQRKKSKASKTATAKQDRLPERLFRFDVVPSPASAPASATTASSSQPTEPQQQQPSRASSWPFPLVLPGTGESAALPPSITTSSKHGIGYEYGPEVYLDRADFWEDFDSSSPSSAKKASRRKEKAKKSKKKEKLCPTNGYQNPAAKSTANNKLVQVKHTYQEKQHMTTTKEYLPGGGTKRVLVTYVSVFNIEEVWPVDEEGNVVEKAGGDGDGSGIARAGETNITMDWSSEEEEEDEDSSDDSESDDDKKKKGKKKGKGKSKKHKLTCPKHPGYAALQRGGKDTDRAKAREPTKTEIDPLKEAINTLDKSTDH